MFTLKKIILTCFTFIFTYFDFLNSFSLPFRNGELLKLVGNCEHILLLNHLVTTYSSNLILYKNKAMRKSGLLLDDNRDVSEAWVICPLVRDWVSLCKTK